MPICPQNLDVLWCPAVPAPTILLEEEEALAFLAENGRSARYITLGVLWVCRTCTAGLLDG
jgi:hypothetical protein